MATPRCAGGDASTTASSGAPGLRQPAGANCFIDI